MTAGSDWIMHESRWLQMQGAEGDAVLVALRTLRNEADAAISIRPEGKNSNFIILLNKKEILKS